MDPLTIASLATSVIPGIAKLFGGGSQIRQAKQLDASNKFTQYQTPSQVLEATKLAEQEFRNGMPGMGAAVNNIGTSAATAFNNGVQGASSSGDVLDLATKVQMGQNSGLNALNNEALSFRTNALGNYTGALNNEAQYADKAYQINQLDPYLRKANLAASLYGAGNMNKFSGLDSSSTAGLAGITALQNNKKTGNNKSGS